AGAGAGAGAGYAGAARGASDAGGAGRGVGRWTLSETPSGSSDSSGPPSPSDGLRRHRATVATYGPATSSAESATGLCNPIAAPAPATAAPLAT
ncbi:hypothetical protein ADK60_14525, partial [Streptomyces sp. XY431]